MLGTERYLSRHLFTADFARPETLVRESYSIATARQVGFQEKWLQDAIIRNPEIVLAPCRESEPNQGRGKMVLLGERSHGG